MGGDADLFGALLAGAALMLAAAMGTAFLVKHLVTAIAAEIEILFSDKGNHHEE